MPIFMGYLFSYGCLHSRRPSQNGNGCLYSWGAYYPDITGCLLAWYYEEEEDGRMLQLSNFLTGLSCISFPVVVANVCKGKGLMFPATPSGWKDNVQVVQ